MALSKKAKGTIVTDTDPEILASSIEKVADAAKKLLGSRLTEKALLLLLSHHSGVPQRDCKLVLESAANLKSYLKKEVAK